MCLGLGCGQSSASTGKSCRRPPRECVLPVLVIWMEHGSLSQAPVFKYLGPPPPRLVVLFWEVVGALGDGDLPEEIRHWRWLWSFAVWMSVSTSCLVFTSWKHKWCDRHLWLLPPCRPCHHRLYPFNLGDRVNTSFLKLLLVGYLIIAMRKVTDTLPNIRNGGKQSGGGRRCGPHS